MATLHIEIPDQKAAALKRTRRALDFSRSVRLDTIVTTDEARLEVRAVVRFGWDKGYAPTPQALRLYQCNILPKVEILESGTGKSVLVLTETKPLPAPNPPRK